MTATIDPDREYTITQAGPLVGLHPSNVQRAIERGDLDARRVNRLSQSAWRITGADLARFAEARRKRLSRPHPGVIFKAESGNAKLGRAAATYVARQSCPTSCPFQSSGCYAEHDNTRTHWDRITAGSHGADPLTLARREAEMIDAAPADRDLRLHVAGDSITEAGTELIASACGRYVDRAKRERGLDVKVWAYTHAWRTVPREAWGSVSVLASCETADDVQHARERGYAAALVVAEFAGEAAHAVGGERIIPCPQQTRGATCTDCRLCFSDARLRERRLAIGFAVHGWGFNKAKAALRKALPMAA